MNISVVILHYESLEDTTACLNSLLQYHGNYNLQIIVVDNGSKFGKIEKIVDNYSNNGNIHFIRLDKNLGFAKGNNKGFVFAKKNLKADIIVLANNDVVFCQLDFMDKLSTAYEKETFDIGGPRIISMSDGKEQNPVALQYRTTKDVRLRIMKLSILLALSYIGLDQICRKIFSKNQNATGFSNNEEYQLHGACLIFTSKYIERYDGLYDRTFMYAEENILKYISQKEGLKMLYLDQLVVLHKGGSSTKKISKKNVSRRMFYYKNSIESNLKLLQMMRED